MIEGGPTPRDDDSSPAALWDAARYLLDWLVNLFGAPEELAGWGVLAPRERGELLGWLRSLEALVRALLLIAAAALPVLERRARSVRSQAGRSGAMIEHEPDAPEKWRVSFRALPPRPGLASSSGAPSVELPSAWPIAERLEAVIRVLNNPEPFAHRLARRLRAQPDLAARVLGPPPTNTRSRPGRWAFEHAHAQALVACAAFDTS